MIFKTILSAEMLELSTFEIKLYIFQFYTKLGAFQVFGLSVKRPYLSYCGSTCLDIKQLLTKCNYASNCL